MHLTDFQATYHEDLSTAGIGINEEALPLVYRKPYIMHKVPGRQLTGVIDNASCVMRFPEKDRWNGKMIIGATPAVRNAFSLDLLLSDIILQKGYAYAACDKATPGLTLRDSSRSMEEWLESYYKLTLEAGRKTVQSYGREADQIYITGVSNGGYVTRAMLERFPELYTGGVEWEGVLWAPKERHLLATLAEWVKAYPVYADLTGGTVQTEKWRCI